MDGRKESTSPTNNANRSPKKSPRISEEDQSDHTPSLPLNTDSEDHLMSSEFVVGTRTAEVIEGDKFYEQGLNARVMDGEVHCSDPFGLNDFLFKCGPRVFNNKRKAQASVSPVHSRPEKSGLPDLNETTEEGRHFKFGGVRIRLNRRRAKQRKNSKTVNTTMEDSEEEEDQMEDSMVEETQIEKGQGEDRSGYDHTNKESDLRDSIQR
ncbi:hypothetical protein L1987_35165 [Smallanthus sonchifolius]|uniref:Uncharacterized protein n=1 Tax=Smallanthus sonchifolius TaxID=185202 RepID=A0ACB9HVU7_9ASTR|nr:hypothetical protein L1987_35165 [Smallanthus sonchifolius]